MQFGSIGCKLEATWNFTGVKMFVLPLVGRIISTPFCYGSCSNRGMGFFSKEVRNSGVSKEVWVLAMVLSWFDSNCLVMRYHIRAVIPVVFLWFLWKSRKKNMF